MAEDKALGKSVNFTVEEGTAEDGKSSGERRIAKRSTERSSFFQKLSRSFKRSGGERGANVDTIRGTHGADFEGTGIIARAGAGVGCCCMGGGEDTKTKLMLIKGVHCFVYKDENAPSPKYTIPLAHLRAKKRNPSMGLTMVQLQSNLGDVEYEVSFSDEDVAKEFESAVNKQATVAETQEVRKVRDCDTFLAVFPWHIRLVLLFLFVSSPTTASWSPRPLEANQIRNVR